MQVNKARANGLQKAFVSDIQHLAFPTDWDESLKGSFDAVFSNATLHWCKQEPAGVLERVKKVLKPGGRFAAELGGFMNVVGVRSALHQVLRQRGYNPVELDPWYFPTADEYKKVSDNPGSSSPTTNGAFVAPRKGGIRSEGDRIVPPFDAPPRNTLRLVGDLRSDVLSERDVR